MKSLFWKKLSNKVVVDSFWKDVDESTIKLDTSKLEELFSKAKFQAKNPSSGKNNSKAKSSISFVDSPPTECWDRSLAWPKRVESKDIKRAIQQIDDRMLSLDILTSLEKLLPTPEERDSINSFEGDKSKLANVEKFFVEILSKDVVQRVKVTKEKASFDDLLKECKGKISTMQSATRELKTSQSFRVFDRSASSWQLLEWWKCKRTSVRFHLETLMKLDVLKTKDNKSSSIYYSIHGFVPKQYEFPKNI